VATLQALRRGKGLSQRQLAKLAAVGRATVVGIQLGWHMPRPPVAQRLAAALAVESEAVDWPFRYASVSVVRGNGYRRLK